ncbi:MAG: diaminopimelate epimerase [Sandaracinaceae bacterium]
MAVPFDKYEGLGNDFILVDESVPMTRERAIALCDRHRGIGADGVLVVGDAPSMRVFNADGSTPEMCGNGVRCVARYLFARGRVRNEPFVLDTEAGPHRVEVRADGTVQVAMRPASLAPADIALDSERPWIDEPIALGARTLHLTAVSMGNPHAVTFDDVGDARRELGPMLEVHPRFRERANIGFASLTADGMDLAVWERGVGWTQACGTGACAAAVAAVVTGRAARHADLTVRLPGGPLTIRVQDDGAPILMTGPARFVFTGEI